MNSLRIIAAGCILLWLMASSSCRIEHLLGGDRQGSKANDSVASPVHDIGRPQEAETAKHSHDEANRCHESETPSHDSHHHHRGESCRCSTLTATAQIVAPFHFIRPILRSLSFIGLWFQQRDPMLASDADAATGQVGRPDFVFTPEVCPGLAHRGLAPPSFA
ncbi:MAG TPA: hypothetical protein VMF06_13880 [Candidatus Limnocylindria bacterium]|jgi:hypothetical protein|nr:hypothetical protein [Candidatus Limnocylindria bacterium]